MEKQSREELVNQREVAKQVEHDFAKKSKALFSNYDKEVKEVLKKSEDYTPYVETTSLGMELKEYLKDTQKKPSDYFKEHQQRFQGWVPEHLLEDFYCSIDAVNKWQYSRGYYRRSLRTKRYEMYVSRIYKIMDYYHAMGIYETDLVSVYQENMPVEKICYFRNGPTRYYRKAIENVWIQAELDRGNQALREELKEILLGEDNQNQITYEMLQGIMMSSDKEMYEAVGKVLLAARLQEGLRQAICENMDAGTPEAFQYLFRLLLEQDLIRYSSVIRAIGTWTGLLFEEQGKLQKNQRKQMELIAEYLGDEQARKEALATEDSMKIYLALWSYGFYEIEDAKRVLKETALSGTKHQRMVSCYYMKMMGFNDVFVHDVAKQVVKNFHHELDTMAVAIDEFMPGCGTYLWELTDERKNKELKRRYTSVGMYFKNKEECETYYKLLMKVLAQIPKKQVEFNPCIFPWNVERLERSTIIVRLAICASALHDEEKITTIAGMLPQVDATGTDRKQLLSLLLLEPKNEKQRQYLVAAVADKEGYTRAFATTVVKRIHLSPENYMQLEEMLKYKKSEIRSNVLSILYPLEGKQLRQTIQRLLNDKKEEKRTAGLDLLMQLKKDEERQEVFTQCIDLVSEMKEATTKEEILLKELKKNQQEEQSAQPGFGLYDETATYEPQFDALYLEHAKSIYVKCFPTATLGEGKGILKTLGKLVHPSQKEKNRLFSIVKKLDKIMEVNKNKEYVTQWGDTEMLGQQRYDLGDAFHTMWESFYAEEIQEYETCLALLVYIRCMFLEEPKFRQFCMPFLVALFGEEYIQKENFCYPNGIRTVLEWLEEKHRNQKVKRSVGVVVADYLLHCNEKMIYEYKEEERSYSKSILSCPPIYEVTYLLSMEKKPEYFKVVFPYQYALAKLHGFNINPQNGYYSNSCTMEKPSVETYLIAHSLGIISKDFLYRMTFEKEVRGESMKTVSNCMQYYLERGRTLTGRQERSWCRNQYKASVECLLGHEIKEELSDQDVKRLELAKMLYDDLSGLIVEAELTRGDTDTEFSKEVYSVTRIYGVEYFVRILAALGKENLERSLYFDSYWYGRRNGVSKRQSLSHLLQVCMPKEEDDAKKLAEYLKGTDITKERVIEAAMYSHEWLPIVSEYLGWDGFEAGCYYFIAHMNENFDDRRQAMIARYTPLEPSELQAGVFDSNWFHEVYEKLGEKRFQIIYKAAKYISDGAKHTRARKYADAALGNYKEKELEETIQDKRNKDLLMAYSLIPIVEGEQQIKHRYLFLQKFLKESKQFGSQRRASEAAAVQTSIRNLAINAGYQDVTRLTLRMESLLTEGMSNYFVPHTVGEVSVWLEVKEGGGLELLCEKVGKRLKSIPAKVKKDEYIIAIKECKKQLTEQYRRTKIMLEEAMENQTEFTFAELKGMIHNRVTKGIAETLVYCFGDAMGFITEEGLQGEREDAGITPLKEEDKLVVAHPYHLYKAGCWHAYQKYMFDHQIKQVFKQVFRELYVKTEEEVGMYHSLRYAGNQIQPEKTVGCLKTRRWVADMDAGLQKVYYKENIVAEMYALADWFSPADIEAPTLEWVVFTDRKTGREKKIGEIPEIIFSEVMRDVDLAVSVAHAGGVDPETSHSTIEMRKAIAEFTLPLFKLTNVTFTKTHALVTGKRADYTVHLGSGVVHQQAGPMIQVLPVHSQRRGRLFLPFVDEDPKTAEVLTKILLFAEDQKIKDPFILEQIKA